MEKQFDLTGIWDSPLLSGNVGPAEGETELDRAASFVHINHWRGTDALLRSHGFPCTEPSSPGSDRSLDWLGLRRLAFCLPPLLQRLSGFVRLHGLPRQYRKWEPDPRHPPAFRNTSGEGIGMGGSVLGPVIADLR